MKSILLTAIILFSNYIQSAAQNKQVRGKIVDSTQTAISAAKVSLISGQDTLYSISNEKGLFLFDAPARASFILQVHALGYLAANVHASINNDNETTTLPDVVLIPVVNQLKTVEIKARLKRSKLRPDTIEHNALAYPSMPGDKLRDLIKKVPGMIVDQDGNVKAMGKKVVEVKVNGKDFFSGNVTELLEELPAGMISKVQLLNDYGDLAAFTGNRAGTSPVKVINLVTRSGLDSGLLGEMGTEAGTNAHYDLSGHVKYWQGTRQLALEGKSEAGNNGAGMDRQHTAGFSANDKLWAGFEGGLSYRYGSDRKISLEDSRSETFGSTADFLSLNRQSDQNDNKVQQFKLQLRRKEMNSYFSASAEGAFENNNGYSRLSSIQDGPVRLEQSGVKSASGKQSAMKGNFMYAYRFAGAGRNLSVSVDVNSTPSTRQSEIADSSLYSNALTGIFTSKVWNRRTAEQNRPKVMNTVISFIEPLDTGSAGASRAVSLNYLAALQSSNDVFRTDTADQYQMYGRLDSLSGSSVSRQLQQGLEFRFLLSKVRYDFTFGLSLQSAVVSGNAASGAGNIRKGNFFLRPIFNFKYRPSEGQVLELAYNGNNVMPEFRYLQPFVDARNLRQLVFGNPNLKAAVVHGLTLQYGREGADGVLLQLNAGVEMTKNAVVSQTATMSDEFGALLQQTRFINANGNQRLEARYNLSWPVRKGLINIELEGGAGSERIVFLSEQQRAFSRQFTVQQTAKLMMAAKHFEMNMGAGYELSRTIFDLDHAITQRLRIWSFIAEGRVLLADHWRLNLQGRKVFNEGYFVGQTHPLVIDAGIELQLFKRRAGMQLQIFDLLGQNNVSSKRIEGNAVVDSRHVQLSRYCRFSVKYNFDRFGQKN